MSPKLLREYEDGYFHRVATRLGVRRNDIDDVCQIAAMKCWAADSSCAEGNEHAYIRVAVRTAATDFRKRSRILQSCELTEEAVPAGSCLYGAPHEVLVDTREYLDVLLRSLSERERNILQAHYLEERPFNEIDPFSGHAARQVAFRAMKKVRKKAPATAK